MKIFVGADYRGFGLKQQLLEFLATKDFTVFDEGTYAPHDSDDFNDPAITVARKVREDMDARGILICDSAHGMTMQANRFKGIRAAHCDTAESAVLAREHDDANVMCLSAHFLDKQTAEQVVEAFLATDFVPLERRIRRINRLDEREDYD